MKRNTLIMAVLIFLVGVSAIWLRVSAPEDKWICEKGEWVKHGNPSDPKPETICGETTQKTENVIADNDEKWNRIKEVIADCGVVSVSQTNDLVVQATLKNSLTVKAKEPAIDDVVKLVEAAKDKCGAVPIATE